MSLNVFAMAFQDGWVRRAVGVTGDLYTNLMANIIISTFILANAHYQMSFLYVHK